MLVRCMDRASGSTYDSRIVIKRKRSFVKIFAFFWTYGDARQSILYVRKMSEFMKRNQMIFVQLDGSMVSTEAKLVCRYSIILPGKVLCSRYGIMVIRKPFSKNLDKER